MVQLSASTLIACPGEIIEVSVLTDAADPRQLWKVVIADTGDNPLLSVELSEIQMTIEVPTDAQLGCYKLLLMEGSDILFDMPFEIGTSEMASGMRRFADSLHRPKAEKTRR